MCWPAPHEQQDAGLGSTKTRVLLLSCIRRQQLWQPKTEQTQTASLQQPAAID
jgi:hypothetical protein